ncbi:MAG: choice-of-anchor J domain-containing protein, partial [Bacteroidales bacterium]|nr:choice-of-anchor J domain-containing protein [Bacteroidales bacterium]
MKKISIFLLLAAFFMPLAMNAQQGIVQQKDVDLFSMPRVSLSELNSKGGDRAVNTLVNENFENVTMYDNQYSATDWFTYNAGSGNNWDLNQPGSSYTHSGSMCMVYGYNSSNAADCYLVSEPFSVSSSMAELSVSLYERVRSNLYAETFEVFFVRANDVTDLASVVSANHYVAIASASYTNKSYAQVSGNTTITALAGQSVRVVVHCTSAANMYNLYIDDITVTENTNDSGCGVADLPHFNGFENEAQYGCWTYSGRDVSLSTSNARTGSYCLRLNGLDDDQDQFLISPEFDGESAMEMSFYYRIADQDRDQFFYVGWGPDLSNISWDPIEIAHNLSYQEYTEVFPKGTKYIVIAVYGRTGTSSDPSYMLLDDITINGGCIKPRGLEADNITTKTVDLTWGDYSDNGYNVAYRTKTIASATLANTRFEDKFNSSSLSTSNWATQNQLYSSTATDWGIRSISGVDAYTGSYYASSRSFDGDEDHSVRNWLITKSMTLGNVVKFYMNENYPAWLDNVDVCVGTDNLTFVVVAKPTVSSAGWEEITIDLSKYAGQTGYIALVHEDEAKDYVCIDDFGVYTYNYTYTYGPWQYTTARTNSVQLTGLTAETTYELQVHSICGENEKSDWSTAIDFNTPSGCTAP